MSRIDTSIYNNLQPTVKLQTPFELQQGFQNIQQGQNQNRLAQMQFQEADRVAAERNALTDVTRQYGNSPEYKNKLLELGNLDAYQKQSKFEGEQQKAAREAKKAQIEELLQKFDVTERVMSGVSDEQTWQAARQELSAVFPEAASSMPQNYDPVMIEQNRAKAMPLKERLAQQWKELEYTTPTANARLSADTSMANARMSAETSRANNAASRAVTMRGQDMTDSRGRDFNATRVEENKIKASTKSQNITEGERKAATLLRRLDFSEKQLQAALKDNSKAEKPGLLQNGLRAIGAEALANTLTGSERQRVEAAQLDILDAALTLGTGAAYTKEQLNSYRQSYFPQLGDSAGQIKDKEARLKNIVEAAKIAAGRAAPTGGGNPPTANTKPNGLSPAEAAELAALKKRFGK